MADEEQPSEPAVAAPAASPAPPPVPAPAPAPAPGLSPASPPVTEPDEPPNKLHEWGAAALIMMLLAGILYTFLSFIRGASM